MQRMKLWHFVILLLAAAVVTACAQPEIYTEPYVSVGPTAYVTPLPVRLITTFSVDGKPNAKRRQEVLAGLGRVVDASGAFKIVDAAAGELTVAVDDSRVKTNRSFLGTLSASVGHVLISQPEFTPEGRRTARELHVTITYAPAMGTVFEKAYTAKLITVTNNTQDPTDLVSLHDRRHAELALISNDLNGFAAVLAKNRATDP